MSNGDEYWSESNHGGNYSNTYSLWGRSKFYDTNNLSPQSYFASANTLPKNEDYQAAASALDLWPPVEPASAPQDNWNRREIKNVPLLDNPDMFYQRNEELSRNPRPVLEPYWTPKYWQNEGSIWSEPAPELLLPSFELPMSYERLKEESKIEEPLNKKMAQTDTMAEAKILTPQTDWLSGALGRSGGVWMDDRGIMEPVLPNLIHAEKIGFDLYQSKLATEQLQEKQTLVGKQIFDVNVMNKILEFVKNNNEVELQFDRALTRSQRKRIHSLVNDLVNAEEPVLEFGDGSSVLELAQQIADRNYYVLLSRSHDDGLDRVLCLYKMPPTHVYLVIPEDLRDEKPGQATADQPQLEPEEDTNPFLRSIIRKLKSSSLEDTKCGYEWNRDHKILNKILKFFSEFAVKEEYTVFRHLGPFGPDEREALAEFQQLATTYLNAGVIRAKYLKVFRKVRFDIKLDVNGHTA